MATDGVDGMSIDGLEDMPAPSAKRGGGGRGSPLAKLRDSEKYARMRMVQHPSGLTGGKRRVMRPDERRTTPLMNINQPVMQMRAAKAARGHPGAPARLTPVRSPAPRRGGGVLTSMAVNVKVRNALVMELTHILHPK